MAGMIPYWGANGIIDHINDAIFDEELVLLGEDGAPFGDPLRDVAFRVTGRIWVNNHIHVLRSGPGTEARFLVHALNAVDWTPFVSGSTRDKLTQEGMKEARVPLWEMSEQRTIADFLDTETARIDALITKKRRLIGLLDRRWRSIRSFAVLGELDPVTGRGEVPGHWAVMNLGVLVELQRGHDLPGNARNEGAVPVISSGGTTGHHDSAAAMGPGVVTGRYGTVGEVFYTEGPYWPLNTTLYVKDFRGCHPRWVYHLLASLPLDIDSAKTAVTGINRNVVGALRVPRPPLARQVDVARELDAEYSFAASLTDKMTRQIELLTEHRQALITAAVTGELDLARPIAEEAS